MESNNNGQSVLGALILFVLVIGLLKGCSGDGRFQYRYDACMEGSIKPTAVFKAIFVCLWV